MSLGYRVVTASSLIILLTSSLAYGHITFGQESKLNIQLFQGVKEGDSIRFYFVLNDGAAHDGTVYFKIMDDIGSILYENEFQIKADDYKDYQFKLTGVSIGKAYEWYVKFDDIKKGIANSIGYGKASLKFTTNGQILTADTTVEIPHYTGEEIATMYEDQYMKTSKVVNQHVSQGNFDVTLVRLGYYKHLEFGSWGKEIKDFRADIAVKNIGAETDSFFTTEAAIVIGSSQYNVSYESKFDGSDIRPGVVKEGYLIFNIPGELSGVGDVIIGKYYSYPNNIEYKFNFDFDSLKTQAPSSETPAQPSEVPKSWIKTDKMEYTDTEKICYSGFANPENAKFTAILESAKTGYYIQVNDANGGSFKGCFKALNEVGEWKVVLFGSFTIITVAEYTFHTIKSTVAPVPAPAPQPTLKSAENMVNLRIIARQNGDSVLVRVTSSPKSQVDVYELHLTLNAGKAISVKPPRGWNFDLDEKTNTIELSTDDNPLKPGKSIRFKAETDASPLSCSWVALDKDLNDVASGTMKARLAR